MYQGEIKEIQLTNFKSFSKTASFPIRPITLIFGPNSSGKSSFIQSLLMMKQSATSENDDKLKSNGSLVNLGGYKSYIFNHDAENNFTIAFTFNLKEFDKIAFGSSFFKINESDSRHDERRLDGKLRQFLALIKGFKQIKIAITFASDSEEVGAEIKEYNIFLGNDPKPFLSYLFEKFRKTGLSYSANYYHEFWEKYWYSFFKGHNNQLLSHMMEDIASWP